MPNVKPSTQVFISYSRRDLTFVKQLASDLKVAGLDVWYDLSGLEGGARWRIEIEKAIRESQYVLVVLSPDSVKSDWVEREYLFASNLGKKLIPLFYKPCDLPMYFLNVHYIDIQGSEYLQNYKEVIRALGIKRNIREAAEKAILAKVEEEAIEKAAREKAEKENTEKAAREASEKAMREEAKRVAIENAKQKKAELRAVRKAALAKKISQAITVLKAPFQKYVYVRRIVALFGIFTVLVLSFWVMPKLKEMNPTTQTNIESSLEVEQFASDFTASPIGTGTPKSTITENIPIPDATDSFIPFEPSSTLTPITKSDPRSIKIVLDDFNRSTYREGTFYFQNRVGGDQGTIYNSNGQRSDGKITISISPSNSRGGLWMNLNHPIEEGFPVNFSGVLPEQILPSYQARITEITIHITEGTSKKTFRIELKDGNTIEWEKETTLSGGEQVINAKLPPLQNISQLVLALDHASPGDYVTIDTVSLIASSSVVDTATAAFVWSYGMLLNNWNPDTGLVRDRANFPSGDFDAIQATGSLAAATVLAEQLGVISRNDAVTIVSKIGDTFLNDVPRCHGLWPHFVKVSSGTISIVDGTEWSSADTVIAAIGLLDSQNALELDTLSTEQMLIDIDWNDLATSDGISHGYNNNCTERLASTWDTFGGESWLVELAYASATNDFTDLLLYPSPQTANGSGFIDEIAWLFVRTPFPLDVWGTDWSVYRNVAAETQISYYPDNFPASCFRQLGLFGLSAAEVPDPARVSQDQIYQPFGVGGQFVPPNDGSGLLGAPVVTPHYSAMIASIRPQETLDMWEWLIEEGHFSPMTNVESLTFPINSNCSTDNLEWNHLKGSWNLALQALGWGRYLVERDGGFPALWQATRSNQFLEGGYSLLKSNFVQDTNLLP